MSNLFLQIDFLLFEYDARSDPKMKRLNVGILAHVDAGKTTTVEQILYSFGQLRNLGSVDKGSTQTDFLAVERERGITVTASSVDFEFDDILISIIDTPGHMDFTGEVERTLSVLDGAVLVVSAAEGIQSQTERFWRALRELEIPTMIFLNKVDRLGCDPAQIVTMLKKEFSNAIIPLTTVENAGSTAATLTNDLLSEVNILALCEQDDDLMEAYLSDEHLTEEQLTRSLVKQVQTDKAYPLIHGASVIGLGIKQLVKAMKTYFPVNSLKPTGEPHGIVYKIEHDKMFGKIAHIRLYQGQLSSRDEVTLYRAGEVAYQGKISQIRKIQGAKHKDIGQFSGNEIAAVCGLTDAKIGDTIGQDFKAKRVQISEPLFTVGVHGPPGKERELLKAISELSDEDPLMDYIFHQEVGELVIRIMGKVQVEILEYLLLERYQLTVTFSEPAVIYKETVTQTGIGLERYTMPKPCWAVVKLKIEPLLVGSGYQFESTIGDNILHLRYQRHVEASLQDAIKQGRLGWEVTDIKVTLIDGEDHHIHTHPLDFFLATPIALMKALEDAGSTLLEPLVKFKMRANEEHLGKIISQILSMRGEFTTPVIENEKIELEAIVPVATSMDYSIQFSSLTSGRGIITSEFYGYQPCPLELGKIAPRIGIDPLDRDKWILHRRGALM